MTIREVPSVTRAIAVLRLLGRLNRGATLSEIARKLKIIPSSCLHILRALAADGWVGIHKERKLYTLDSGVLELARGFLRRNSFAHVVQPHLERISREFGVNTMAVRPLHVDKAIVVALSYSGHPVRLNIEVGESFSPFNSATGCILAAYGDIDADTVKESFYKLKHRRLQSFTRFREQIALARESGFSIDEGTFIAGVSGIAVPVLDRGGKLKYSISAWGMKEALSAKRYRQIAKALKISAAAVANEIDLDTVSNTYDGPRQRISEIDTLTDGK